MAAFRYQALTANGQATRGEIDAVDRRDALRQLELMDLTPTQLEGGASATVTAEGNDAAAPTLSAKQIILFTEDLCDLLEAGLPLDPAMAVLEKRQSKDSLRVTASRIRKHLREGNNFSRALRNSSPSFSALYCSIAEAGEAGGALAQILRQHVIYLNALAGLRAKAVQALIYPAFILAAGVLVMILFVTNLVPQLEQLFTQSGNTPPLLTRILMNGGKFMLSYWWLVLGFVFAAAAGFKLYIATPSGFRWWGQARQSIPGFGPVLRTHFLAQFSKTLSSLLENGIPLLNALRLVRNGVTNPFYGEALDRAIVLVGDGMPLSSSLRQTAAFPPLFLDLLTVGEQTGRLARSLDKASDRFEKEMDIKIKQLIAMIGPVVILILACVVGVVAYSVITSIFETIQNVRSRF